MLKTFCQAQPHYFAGSLGSGDGLTVMTYFHCFSQNRFYV